MCGSVNSVLMHWALSVGVRAGATLSGFATLVFYFTGAAMLEGPQPFAERFLLCRPAFWWSLAAVALCVLLGRLGHLLLRAFPEEQPPAAASSAEPAAPSEPAVRAKPAASSQPVTGERAVRAEAPASAAEQQLLRPAHHRAAATQPSATCGAAPRTGTTSRRLIVHRRAGAMCTFDFVTEVRSAAFCCMTHSLTAAVCDPPHHASVSTQQLQRSF